MTLVDIVFTLLLYDNDIILMERNPSDIDKKLRIIKDFYSNMGMIVSTDKTNVMIIIKSRKVTYANFVYENRNLEEVTLYKYL